MPGISQAQQVIWFSRILRWLLGGVFMYIGIRFIYQDGWPAIVFGGIIFITGFFKPRRCLEDGCELPQQNKQQHTS